MMASCTVVIDEFSKFADILSAPLSQHRLLGFAIAQLEFHHLHYLCLNKTEVKGAGPLSS